MRSAYDEVLSDQEVIDNFFKDEVGNWRFDSILPDVNNIEKTKFNWKK